MGATAQAAAAATPTDTPSQNTLAGQVAENGMVLLKNQERCCHCSRPRRPSR